MGWGVQVGDASGRCNALIEVRLQHRLLLIAYSLWSDCLQPHFNQQLLGTDYIVLNTLFVMKYKARKVITCHVTFNMT